MTFGIRVFRAPWLNLAGGTHVGGVNKDGFLVIIAKFTWDAISQFSNCGVWMCAMGVNGSPRCGAPLPYLGICRLVGLVFFSGKILLSKYILFF